VLNEKSEGLIDVKGRREGETVMQSAASGGWAIETLRTSLLPGLEPKQRGRGRAGNAKARWSDGPLHGRPRRSPIFIRRCSGACTRTPEVMAIYSIRKKASASRKKKRGQGEEDYDTHDREAHQKNGRARGPREGPAVKE